MKKVIALILALATMLSLCACGSAKKEPQMPPKKHEPTSEEIAAKLEKLYDKPIRNFAETPEETRPVWESPLSDNDEVVCDPDANVDWAAQYDSFIQNYDFSCYNTQSTMEGFFKLYSITQEQGETYTYMSNTDQNDGVTRSAVMESWDNVDECIYYLTLTTRQDEVQHYYAVHSHKDDAYQPVPDSVFSFPYENIETQHVGSNYSTDVPFRETYDKIQVLTGDDTEELIVNVDRDTQRIALINWNIPDPQIQGFSLRYNIVYLNHKIPSVYIASDATQVTYDRMMEKYETHFGNMPPVFGG